MPYLGNEPATAYTSTTKDSFSGDGSTTAFTMSKSANVNAVRVVVENVIQDPTVAYTCSGTTLTFTSAPPSGTNNIYVVHLGPPAATVAPPTTINNATTFTGGVTLKNETPEDTDGGRESIVTFQGTQSGSEVSTLAEIQASHDGTSDDEKGDLIFKTNDGSDGASPTERMRIDSAGTVTISSASTDAQLLLENTNASATGSPTIDLYRNSASPADNDLGGSIKFHAENDAGEKIQYQIIQAYMPDVSDGSEDGAFQQYVMKDGTSIQRMEHNPTETVFNQDSADVNFRVESDGNANMLFVDAGNNRVGMGTNSPSGNVNANSTVLEVNGSGSNPPEVLAGGENAELSIAGGSAASYLWSTGNYPLIVATNGAEQFRFTTDKQILVGNTGGVGSSQAGVQVAGTDGYNFWRSATTATTGYDQLVFINGNGVVGRVTTSGSGTTYGSGSDYRLKENVVDISDGITRVKQLSPRRFNFIADADTTVDGFLAHEAQTVVPEAVTGTKDAVEIWKEHEELPDGVSVGDNKLDDDGNTIPEYQAIDQSKLVPLLTAALQEAIAKIETLETKVAALEAE